MASSWFPKQSVVVPVDFSDESLAAVDTALSVASSPRGIHVVHVIPEMYPTEPGVIWELLDNTVRIKHAQDALRERIHGKAYDDIHFHARVGDPGREIADFAKEIKADLIVMPSHGRTGLKHLLIGSVAERVVRLAHCPVLVLRD